MSPWLFVRFPESAMSQASTYSGSLLASARHHKLMVTTGKVERARRREDDAPAPVRSAAGGLG